MDCPRRSRPALVERTNSTDDMHDIQPPSCEKPTRRRSGSKNSKSILREKAAYSSHQSWSDDGTTATSSSSSSSRVSFVTDDNFETKFYDPAAAATETVSTDSCSSISSQEGDGCGTSSMINQQESPGASSSSSSPAAAPPAAIAPFSYLEKSPAWMGDSTLSNTDVFHKRLNRPAVMIQAIVRGVIQRRKFRQERINRLKQELYELEYYAVSLIQARVRGMQQREHYALCRAVMPMQAAVRGWICRMKLQAKSLQQRLDHVLSSHRRELEEIEQHKQREMKRIYKDLTEAAAEKERQQDQERKEITGLIDDLRENNTRLRSENEILRNANIMMAKKNERTMKMTQETFKNIKEVESTLPKLQADHDNIQRVHRECKLVIKQYQQALASCQENFDGEKRISNTFVTGIASMLKEIEAKSSNKKLAQVMSKTANRKIRIAKKEQEKSNKLAGGDGPSTTTP